MSFCTVHQMRMGPRGCPQCAREDALAHGAESGRFWRWAAMVFGALVLLAAAVLALVPLRRPARVLDPAPHRAAIEATESALYAPGLMPPAERAALLEDGLYRLCQELRKPPPTAARRRAYEGYHKFCTMTPLMAGEASFDVVASRREWEALRAEHFKPVPWFRTGTAALVAAQTSAEARGIPDDADKYQAVLDQLSLMATRLETEVPPDYYSPDAEGRWREQRGALEHDVERLRQEMPRSFAGMAPGWVRARNDLEAARRGLSSAVSASRDRSRQAPRGRRLIAQAQASLDAAPR
jgi:hypothetical protein